MANKNNKKEITIPEPREKLAEFLGIFLGDGGFVTKYQIKISFNYKTEQTYAEYILRLIKDLFGLRGSISIRPEYGSGDVTVSSVALVDFLNTQAMQLGDKIKMESSFPHWVFKSTETQRAAVKGLFDTDGCIYFHSYKASGTIYRYPKIAFTSYSPPIRKQFFDLLVLLGFHPREYGMRVHLYSQDETLKYYREIGTQNPIHRARFEEFCKDLELEQIFTAVN